MSPTRSRTLLENKISKYLTKTRKQAGIEQGYKQPTMTCENTSLVGKDGVSHDAHPVPSLVKGVNNYFTKNGKLLKLGVKERKERTEVKREVGEEGGHREGPMENDSGKISLVGEKGVHRTPSPFPSLDEGVRHKTTRTGRPAQPGPEMMNQSLI